MRLMNEAGVLGRFVPDFGKIVALMQFNMYHSYTVDEHFSARSEPRRHRKQRSTVEHKLAQEIMLASMIDGVSIVALFLHDIAKGRDRRSFDRRRGGGTELCPRLGLSDGKPRMSPG